MAGVDNDRPLVPTDHFQNLKAYNRQALNLAVESTLPQSFRHDQSGPRSSCRYGLPIPAIIHLGLILT